MQKNRTMAERKDPMPEAEVDENLKETFPASDPPSWTLGTEHKEKPAPPAEDQPRRDRPDQDPDGSS